MNKDVLRCNRYCYEALQDDGTVWFEVFVTEPEIWEISNTLHIAGVETFKMSHVEVNVLCALDIAGYGFEKVELINKDEKETPVVVMREYKSWKTHIPMSFDDDTRMKILQYDISAIEKHLEEYRKYRYEKSKKFTDKKYTSYSMSWLDINSRSSQKKG